MALLPSPDPEPERKKGAGERRKSLARPQTASVQAPVPPARVAKRPTPAALPEEKPVSPEAEPEAAAAPANKAEQWKAAPESPAPPPHERPAIVQRQLPTLKELLPPVTWAPPRQSARGNGEAVRLDTREPKYISYFASIKRAIELVWEYPEPALRSGFQGKLVIEFTILGNGHLDKTRLLRSSGFPVLDQEAMRAVKAASPFRPIPPWIGKNRLDITASFEYLDNRVRYGVMP
ncbi:MAG: energy transducer TonB [Deltaproteobacteria bacterium]|nr:energy transducer TonB [Deltaproteobacteria bacterium]